MNLEFLICGTPNDAFCSQIAFFRLCLDFLGGSYKNARLVAVFGDHSEESIPKRWQKHFTNIEIVWAHKVGEENIDYSAQHYKRFEVLDERADLSIICDADTLLLNSLDHIFNFEIENNLFGVTAHYHFPADVTGNGPQEDWKFLFNALLSKEPKFSAYYSLKPQEGEFEAPFYINYGFLAASPKTLKRLYKAEKEIISDVEKYVGTYWAAQIAVTFAAEKAEISTTSLPMRFNYPNDPIADELYPEEMENIVLMHYLRRNQFDRQEIFSTEQSFNKFLDLGLAGSNKVFQDHVKRVTNETYPFRSGD